MRYVPVLLLLLIGSVYASPSCLTRNEARTKWPEAHLYWHGRGRCWDTRAGGGWRVVSRTYYSRFVEDANGNPANRPTLMTPQGSIEPPLLVHTWYGVLASADNFKMPDLFHSISVERPTLYSEDEFNFLDAQAPDPPPRRGSFGLLMLVAMSGVFGGWYLITRRMKRV